MSKLLEEHILQNFVKIIRRTHVKTKFKTAADKIIVIIHY